MSMNFTVTIDDDLAAKINERLPRSVKISPLCRWLLRGIILTPKEIEEVCKTNQDEATAVAPFIERSLRTIFEGVQKVSEEKGETE